MPMSAKTIVKGPVFNGRAFAASEVFLKSSEAELAGYAEKRIHDVLGEVLRNPTGRYDSSITVLHEGNGFQVIGDNVVYGPWLEGVGSRNQTTRFKGYFTFRKVAQEVKEKVHVVVAPLLHVAIGRMNI